MNTVKKINRDVDDADDVDITHTVAVSVTATGLSSANTLPSAPDLSNNTLVVLQLKDTHKNIYGCSILGGDF